MQHGTSLLAGIVKESTSVFMVVYNVLCVKVGRAYDNNMMSFPFLSFLVTSQAQAAIRDRRCQQQS